MRARRRAAPGARASASPRPSGFLPPARAIVGRPPPPPPTIGAISFTTSPAEIRFATPSSKFATRCTVPFSRVAEHDRGRRAPLLEAVGEVEQRVGAEPGTSITITFVPSTTATSGSTSAGAASAPSASSPRAAPARARPRRVELARAAVQERPRLARRDRLDPPRAGADGGLAEDHERADLGRRADVRAAAELAREAVDLDHAHLARRTSRRRASSRRACAPPRSASRTSAPGSPRTPSR